jgi:hypothetical protein
VNDVILVYSKFSKNYHNNISFDVVLHKNVFYTGVNLFKNFINYLCDNKSVSAIKFTNKIDAEKYFNDFVF